MMDVRRRGAARDRLQAADLSAGQLGAEERGRKLLVLEQHRRAQALSLRRSSVRCQGAPLGADDVSAELTEGRLVEIVR